MAVKIVEDSAVLTLDFWGKEVIYNGQVFRWARWPVMP